ncbi:MAG: hypothetical protein BJ554DRAFT_647 [Olpidium bornovanus]|uniref:Uncharacterized protein n=1 Tax=Olpidium bornovanus TaxID=278681 RepID=A0A8H8DHQ3_9FUNG|nr:MAG: hypothetical protein BJ554DRAFT_647 [Olpidium bornovanus]
MGGDVFFASTDSASPCFPLQPPSPHSVSRHGRHHNHAFFAPGCGGGGGPSRPAAAALRHAGGGPSRPAAALPPSPSAVDAPARPHALPSVSFLAAKERRLAARDSASCE